MDKPTKSSSKVYLDIVEQLKMMIEDDGLIPGDKIPSERELSERLQVGRSSVREALRSLELLGLIETRRGEGTFIKNFQEHKLVDILGSFFLQEQKAKENLLETKMLIEMDCLKLAIRDASDDQIEELIDFVTNQDFDDYAFFKRIAAIHNNHLLERIWLAIGSYQNSMTTRSQVHLKEPYLLLLSILKQRDETQLLNTYMNSLRNLSNAL